MDAYEFEDAKPVIISTVVVLNIVMNSLVIAVIARYPVLREDRTGLFMFSLCVADLAGGCTAMPISAALCSRLTPIVRRTTDYLPEIQMFCFWWFGFSSLYSLSSVAVSKMVAILKPLRYEQLVTRNRCYGVIVFIWVVGAVQAAPKFWIDATWNLSMCTYRSPANNKFVSRIILSTYVIAVVIPNIVLIFATFRIFVVVVRTQRQIAAQLQSMGTRVGDNDAVNPGLVTVQAIRSAKNILIICFVSLALNVPLLTFAVLRHAIHDERITSVFRFGAMWIYICNSFMNSFLYLVLYRSVRKKIVCMFTDMRDFIRCD